MRQPEDTEGMGPGIERELEAIERALAGEPVDQDLADLAELATDLRGERPQAREQWGLEMDVKAGEGFSSSRAGLSALAGGLLDRGRELGLRRVLLPAGAVATTLIVVAVAVTGPGSNPNAESGDPSALDSIETAPTEGGADGPLGGSAESGEASRLQIPPGAGAAGGLGGQPPSVDSAAAQDRLAPGTAKRRQDRSAFLALKTDTEKVRDVSDQAVQITESSGGVVRSQNLNETDQRATADLDLSIPTRELDSVLDQLTDLATVQSLSEGALDITRPFVSARDRLKDARAERTELLRALGNASDDQEAEAIRGQLTDVRREISRAEAAFDSIARRARNADVTLRVEGTPDGDGSWTLGDAADDALSALKTVAGVLLVGAAILIPIALLITAFAYAAMRVRRRRRENALDA